MKAKDSLRIDAQMIKYERRKKAQMKITVIIHLANVNSVDSSSKAHGVSFSKVISKYFSY